MHREGDPCNRAFGTGAGTGIIVSLQDPIASAWTVIIDGVTGTGAGTCVIQIMDAAGNFQTVTSPAWSFTVTAATVFVVNLPGPCLGLQVNCTAFTSGVINASIMGQ